MGMVKTSELNGVALNWAVAQCTGEKVEIVSVISYGVEVGKCVLLTDQQDDFGQIPYDPSESWEQGGPIIHDEWISLLTPTENDHFWVSVKDGFSDLATGLTPLVAAMRCLVTNKMGEEIEIPEELK